jgi:hypothetical protein
MQPEPLQRSPWNLVLEAVLEHPDLTKSALRLYLVLMRCIVGFRKPEERLGEDLLRREGGFDGRTFERARQELVEVGLLHYEPGSRGAGHRSLYRLINPALERALNPAQERGINPAENPAENPALSVEKTPRQSGDEVLRRMNGEGSPAPTDPDGSSPGSPDGNSLASVAETAIRRVWFEYDDAAIIEEIDGLERKSKRGKKVTVDEREWLLSLARDLREPEPSLEEPAV